MKNILLNFVFFFFDIMAFFIFKGSIVKAFFKDNLANFIVFILCFSGALVFLSAYFIARNFESADLSVILFHLQFPLLDGDNNAHFIGKYLKTVIVPSFILAFCISFTHCVVKMLKSFYEMVVFLLSKKGAKISLAVLLFALCLNMTNNKLKITRYLKTQQEYSSLYEKHYKAFDSTALANFSLQNPRNIIIIFAESLESTFSAKNTPANGGGGFVFSLWRVNSSS